MKTTSKKTATPTAAEIRDAIHTQRVAAALLAWEKRHANRRAGKGK